MFKNLSADLVWSGRTCPAGPVRQIWVSGPVRSGNSYAQSGRALAWTQAKSNPRPLEGEGNSASIPQKSRGQLLPPAPWFRRS